MRTLIDVMIGLFMGMDMMQKSWRWSRREILTMQFLVLLRAAEILSRPKLSSLYRAHFGAEVLIFRN
jgi:hypothetical protein